MTREDSEQSTGGTKYRRDELKGSAYKKGVGAIRSALCAFDVDDFGR